MRERGDLDVLHEPFMYHYYIHCDRPKFSGFEPEPGHPTAFNDIRDMVRARARQAPVFLKDMAYYVADSILHDAQFAHEIQHAFLIRDPAEAVVSYAKRQADFACVEVGIEAQWDLFCHLKTLGKDPVVLNAAAIRADPGTQMARYWAAVGLPDRPAALTWDRRVPAGWRSVQTWHSDVLQTRSILPPDPTQDIAAELSVLPQRFQDMAHHHQVFYDHLAAVAVAQQTTVL